jgi:VanZ family protein
LWIVLYGVWLIAIAVLSLDSNPPQVDLGVLGWDKLQHAGAYALLTFLGIMAFRPLGRSLPFTALTAFAISFVLGGALELGQGALTATRFADSHDLLANTLGAVAGIAAAFPFTSSMRRAHS